MTIINNFFKIILLLLFFLVFMKSGTAQENNTPIHWKTIEEVNDVLPSQPKKIFIDLYTDWCGWCKKMDATTFADSAVAEFMNQHFYAVKFNAERKDSVVFNNRVFINENPMKNRNPHQIAIALLNGKMSYPSYAFLDEEGKMITVAPGYMKADQFIVILKYIAEDAYTKEPWETYKARFLKTE